MRRSPLIVFILVWLTIGLYGIYWLFDTVRLLNSRHHKKKYNTRFLGWAVGIFLGTYLAGILFVDIAMRSGTTISPGLQILLMILFLMALLWNLFVIFGVSNISRRIREVEIQDDIEDPINPGISLLAFFFFFTAFPYMQHHINRIVQMEPTTTT